MFRFLPLMVLFLALIQPAPAQAQCLVINLSGDVGEKYKHFRDHQKAKRHGHKKKKHGCRGHHRHHQHHRPPCMVCRIPDELLADIIEQNKPKPKPKPKPAPTDKGFCKFQKGEFRSGKFLIGGQPHFLSLLISNKDLIVELIWLNNERNVSDDGKYIAFPEGFANPAEPSQVLLTQFPDKAQSESKAFKCNNTRSLVWNSHSGRVIPNFFGGRINMVYTQNMIYTETSFTTDLSSTAFMPIQLKRIPDKKTAKKR